MAEYTEDALEEAVSEYGELFVVLESGEEYEIHGNRGYDLISRVDGSWVEAEGKRGDEWVVVEFPLDAVEHVRSHKEI